MAPLRSLTIVGVGLIGGSIGLAVRARMPGAKVVGYGSRPQTLEAARKQGAITDIAAEPAAAVADAELVVVCAPVDHIASQVERLAPLCRAGMLFTDAGSTKVEIVAALERGADRWPQGVRFVGSHPLAGSEKSGIQHARADLFVDRTVIVTPTDRAQAADRRTLGEFWTALGARIVEMSPQEHDAALAATSHLPHVVAAALAATTPPEYLALTAGGWQDTTRIAAADPTLWRQIMLANRDRLLAALDQYSTQLAAWREALETGDAAKLERLLADAKRLRDRHSS
jgi:prephenate dehydrogenase